MEDHQDKINEFIVYLISNGKSKITAGNYARFLRDYFRLGYVLDEASFIKFANASKSKGFSANTLNNYVKAIKSFVRWLDLGSTAYDRSIKKIKTISIDKRSRTTGFLNDREVKELLSAVSEGENSRSDHSRKTYTALFSIIAYMGIKPGEATSLRRKDVHLNRRLVILKSGERPIPYALGGVFEWLYLHCAEHIPLLHTYEGTPVSAQNQGAEFKNRLTRIGIYEDEIKRRNLSVMSLYFSFIDRCVRKGMPLDNLVKILGLRGLEAILYVLERTSISKDALAKSLDLVLDDVHLKNY